MKTSVRSTVRVAVLCLLVGLCAGIAVVVALRAGHTARVSVTSDQIGERLKAVGELVSLEYDYQSVASIEKAKYQVWGIDVPFTGNRAIFTYEGVIHYGVSVRDVAVSVDGETVTLTIPKSRIVSHEIPEESIEIFDAGRNVFNPVTIEDYVDFQVEQKAAMEAKAAEKGLPVSAQENAGETLAAFLSAMPGMEAYTVEIRYA